MPDFSAACGGKNSGLYSELILELWMEQILARFAVSMSEFKKNPAAVLRDANSEPVAVLNHNKAAFYMIEPRLFEAMMAELADRDLHEEVVRRRSERAEAVEVDIDDL